MTPTIVYEALGRAFIRRVCAATVLYLTILSATTIATPQFDSRYPALTIWWAGGAALFILLMALAARATPPGRQSIIAARVLVGLLTAAVAVAAGFILMVNIWERMGLGH